MSIDIVKLENIKNKIEYMSKINQIEILKILKKNPNIKLNENKNGVYINLSFLPNETLEEMNYYLNYVLEQEQSIEKIEKQKNDFKNEFFTESEM
jgi:hypothetical protein